MAMKVPALAGVLMLLGGVLLATPQVSYAVPCEHGQHVGNPHCDDDSSPGPPTGEVPSVGLPPGEGPSLGLPVAFATAPELDSVLLFGVGLVGLVGFIWYQRRKQPVA
jgi:hypothetical protein